jgi:hypothetical protein
MNANLLALVQQALGGDFSKLAGQFLGESPGSTQTALSFVGSGGIFVGGEAQPAKTESVNVMAVNASLRGGEESGLYILPDSVLLRIQTDTANPSSAIACHWPGQSAVLLSD